MSSIASTGGTTADNIVRVYETGEESCTIESRCDAHLEMVDGEMILMPSNEVARSISAIFKSYLHPTGFAWKMVPMDKRMFYWNEFKKEYRWACTDDEVLPIFLKKCSERYTNLLYNMKSDYLAGTKPEYVKDEDWPGWIAYWEAEPQEPGSPRSSSSSRGGLMYTQEELDAMLEKQTIMYSKFIAQFKEMYEQKQEKMMKEMQDRMLQKVQAQMQAHMESMLEQFISQRSGSKGKGSGGPNGGSS